MMMSWVPSNQCRLALMASRNPPLPFSSSPSNAKATLTGRDPPVSLLSSIISFTAYTNASMGPCAAQSERLLMICYPPGAHAFQMAWLGASSACFTRESAGKYKSTCNTAIMLSRARQCLTDTDPFEWGCAAFDVIFNHIMNEHSKFVLTGT